MKLAMCQVNTVVGDLENNVSGLLDIYNKYQSKADLLIFPELYITGYSPLDIVEREDFVQKQLDLIYKKLVPSIKSTAVIFGGISRHTSSGKGLHNSAYFVCNGEVKAIVNKQLLPTYKLFDERRYFEPARMDTGVIVYKGSRIGLSICEDMWSAGSGTNNLYDKNPVDNLCQKGVDLLINISASPFDITKEKKREEIIKTYIDKWKVPFAIVNYVGANDSIVFDGNSRLYSGSGKVIASAASFREDIVIGDINSTRYITEDAKSDLDNIHNAIVLGIRDYVNKTGHKGVIVGSSGGIDSALCAVLAARAVGEKNVTCITMPSKYSSRGSVEHSKKLCKNLGVELLTVPIEGIFDQFCNDYSAFTGNKPEGLALENIQPRLRALILMAHSNMSDGKILIATGNKSEIAVGYCTLYGDTCGAIAPIGDLYKTQVYELAKYINRPGEIIPKEIIEKAPSAELRFEQKDSDSLPEYEVLDAILKLYIDEKKPAGFIAGKLNYDVELVNRVARLVYVNEFKRRQLPPVIKVSDFSFVLDRRYPVVHKFS
ncbi:MAG: NAD+ synthase [Oligoflexia bacterium]|nr:NAD+ synthase [Oligoflexia bacterium]